MLISNVRDTANKSGSSPGKCDSATSGHWLQCNRLRQFLRRRLEGLYVLSSGL